MPKLYFSILILALFGCSKNIETIQIQLPDKPFSQFIAHAGGEIDGYTYTNSLEAMNLSYSKGCKIFELDIIETSDGKLVAAHDWAHYSILTWKDDYKNSAMLESDFLNLKIYGKFTPMNMQMIND